MFIRFIILFAVVFVKTSCYNIDIESEYPIDDRAIELKTNKRHYEIYELDLIFLIPNPMTEREVMTPIRYRKVIPSFEPDKKEPPKWYSQPLPNDATFKVGAFKKLNKWYKLKNYISDTRASIIFYVAAPGENQFHQRVRTLFECETSRYPFMRRRDQYVIFIDCNIPSLMQLEQKSHREQMVKCAQNVSVCHNQLNKMYSDYDTNFIGMGVSAHILATAAVLGLFKPDRITALDAMRKRDLYLFNNVHFSLRLTPLNGNSAMVVVAFYSNMRHHGMRETIKGAVNIIINDGSYQHSCTKPVRPVTEYKVKGHSMWTFYYGAKDYCCHEFSSVIFAYYIRFSGGGRKANLCKNFKEYTDYCRHSLENVIRIGLLSRGAYLHTKRGDYYFSATDHFVFYPEHYLTSQKEPRRSQSSTALLSRSYSDSPSS